MSFSIDETEPGGNFEDGEMEADALGFSWPRPSINEGNAGLVTGIVMVGAMMLMALIGIIHPPYNPDAMNIANRFLAPSWQHWMGTDEYGRDLLSRDMIAVANAWVIAFCAVASGLLAGTIIGAVAGYVGGWIAEALMRLMDATFAFPHLILALLILTVMGPGRIPVALAVGIFNIPIFARLAYGAVLEGKQQLYVVAARSMGGRWPYVLRRHVLFYAAPILLVQVTSSIGGAVLAEAALSFLGLGTQPPTPDLGAMLSSSVMYIAESIWTAVFPGLTLLVMVMGVNLIGDGLEGRLGRW